METTNYVLAYPDGDSLLLFNPYHDEKGRFTSKNRAISISGTLPTVTKISEKETEDGIEALFSGNHCTVAITVPGDMDKEDIKEVQNAVALAADSMKAIGIKGTGGHIKFYSDIDKYAKAIRRESVERDELPLGMVDFDNIAHIGPEEFGVIRRYCQYKENDIEASRAIGTIIHELYHGRREGGGWQGRAFPSWIEEGLASFAEGLGLIGLRTGDYKLEKIATIDALRAYIRHRRDTGQYGEYMDMIRTAAREKQDQEGTWAWTSVLEWVQSGSRDIGRDIKRWYAEFEKTFRHEHVDDTILLYNPYHDVKGRFTEQQHAVKPLPEDKIHIHGKADQKATFRAADATSLASERMKQKPSELHIYDNMDDYIKDSCRKATDKNECVTRASNSYASYVNGAIRVSPIGAATMKKDRAFAERIIAHEAMHSRKRKGGAIGPKFGKDKYENYTKRDIEEATTDMLAMRITGGKPMYSPQMGAISLMVGKVSGWDQKEAWKMIDDTHFNINNNAYLEKLMTDFVGGTPKGGWTPSTIYALLAELQKSSTQNNHQALAWMMQGAK